MAVKEDFRYIVRIANADLDGNKPINHALTKIKGVNFMYANLLCALANVSKRKRTGELSDAEINAISGILKEPSKYNVPKWMMNRRKDYISGEDRHLLAADLAFYKDNDIKKLKKIKSYRGLRHQWGLPVRGQRTRSNFRKNKRKGGSLGVVRSAQAKKAASAKEKE